MKGLTRTGKKINSGIGKAIGEYKLIEDGDKILVAVSGGKDSLTLLTLLKEIQRWAPVKYELVAAHVKADFACGSAHTGALADILERMGVEYTFRDVKVIDEKGETTCFWCSWTRRKALFEIADELGCNKVALGHHKDDIVETMLMNLFYNGEISAMNPRQELFRGRIVIIRPLCYVEEGLVRKFAEENGFPDKLRGCPFGEDSKRNHVKDIIRQTERKTPGLNVKTNIFQSLKRIKTDYIDLK